jgi:type IV secretion system protein VirB9
MPIMKAEIVTLSLVLGVPSLALAQQQVPAIDTTASYTPAAAQAPAGGTASAGTTDADKSQAPQIAPPPVNLLSGRQVSLSPKEQRAVRLSDEWKRRADMPTRGQEGAVVFTFGATLPTVVCAPLYPCNLLLQPGEVVQQLDVGDPVRWKVTPSFYGTGSNATTALVIKPTDSGLESALTVSTDRRLYVVKLASRLRDWMPKVAFSYPEDVQQAWAHYYAAQGRAREATVMSDGMNIDALDFGFRISGDSPSWRPIRVYTDGRKTYIQFPREMQFDEAPALVALGNDAGLFSSPSKQLVNYRKVRDRYVVDKVLTRAALISGVGSDQTQVEITREEGR